MKDNFGREIEYLRISVTDLCNLRCKYCMPKEGVEKKEHCDIISYQEISNIVKAACKFGVNKIRLTGGEPLVRREIVSLVKMIKDIAPNIDLAMTTNGILLDKYADELKTAGLDRVNISIDTLDDKKFKYITRGGDINDVFRGIEVAKEHELFPLKINTVLINGFNNDEIADFINMTVDEDIEVRFIELMPIGQNAHELSRERYLSNQAVLDMVPELVEIEDYNSKVCRYYQMPNAKGKIGLISPSSHKFCDRCDRIRITSDAKIKPCLHSNQEIDIRQMILDGFSYEDVLSRAINNKPKMHRFDENIFVKRNMNRIGG